MIEYFRHIPRNADNGTTNKQTDTQTDTVTYRLNQSRANSENA